MMKMLNKFRRYLICKLLKPEYEEDGNTFCKDCKSMSNWEWNEE